MNWRKVPRLALGLAISFLAVLLPVPAKAAAGDGIQAIRDYTSNENGYVRCDLPVFVEDEAFTFEADVRYVAGENQQYYMLFGITFADYVASSWEVRLQLGESAGSSQVAIYRMQGDTGTRVMSWKAFPAESDKTNFHLAVSMDDQGVVTVSIDGQAVGTLDVSAEYRGGWLAVATHTTKAVFSNMQVRAASLASTEPPETTGSDATEGSTTSTDSTTSAGSTASAASAASTNHTASTEPPSEQPSTGVVFPAAVVSAAGVSALALVLARRRNAVRKPRR